MSVMEQPSPSEGPGAAGTVLVGFQVLHFCGALRDQPHQERSAAPMLAPQPWGWPQLGERKLQPGSLHGRGLSMPRLMSNQRL